jgi:hypothetical protein
MLLWRILWRTNPLLLALMVACGSTPRIARVESGARGETILHIPRTATVEPREVTPREATEAIQRMARQVRLPASPRETAERALRLDAHYGNYLYLPRDGKLVPLDSGTSLDGVLTEEEQRLVSRYKAWCRSAHQFEGDCLGGALVAGKYLDLQGRYMWAMALSKSPVLEEFEKALGEMVSMQAIMQAAMWTVVTLLVLLAMPDPVTKFVAAWATLALVLWVGATTLYKLITGWFQLQEEVKVATTFEEIREAGEKFGKMFSREAAQAFAMMAMVLLTHSAQGFAKQVATLPGSAQVSMNAAAQEGVLLSEVAAAESVAVTAEGFSVALPPFAVAMAARPGRGEWVDDHHIATIANDKSTLRGGPWTPRFRRLFAKAGMSMKDPENVAPTMGHKGPHPERYHQLVLDELETATRNCRTMEMCREKLTRALRALAKEIVTPGTELNQLVTRTQPR